MVLLAHLPLQGDLRAVNYSPTEQNGVHPIDGAPYDFTSSKGGNEIFSPITQIGGGSHERLSGIKALKLETTGGTKFITSSSLPSGINWVSFWAYKGSWALYIWNPYGFGPFNTRLFKNGIPSTDFTYITFSGSTFKFEDLSGDDIYITDVRFYKFDDVSDAMSLYNSLNKHPKTPTFGFYQQSHNESIGIIGNQISNSLVAYKKGDNDLSFNLADIECNEIHSKTIDDLKDDIQNIDLSGKADVSALELLSSTVDGKADSVHNHDGTYLKTLPSSANFTSLSVGGAAVLTSLPSHNHDGTYLKTLPSSANFTSLSVGGAAVLTSLPSHNHDGTYLKTLPSSANFTSLSVGGAAVLTSLPSSANFTSLSVGGAAVLTSLPSHNHDDTYLKSLPSSANFTSLSVNDKAVLTSLPTTANFTSLSVNDKAVLTSLPTTANFTSLSVGGAAVLTSLPTTANFTSLSVGGAAVLTSLPTTANFTSLSVGGAAVLTSLPSHNHDYMNLVNPTFSFDDSSGTRQDDINLGTMKELVDSLDANKADFSDLEEVSEDLADIQKKQIPGIQNKQPPLVSHIPLQSNLDGNSPDSNASLTKPSRFLVVSDINTGTLTSETLHVSNTSNFEGAYYPVRTHSVVNLFIYDAGNVRQVTFDAYDPQKPLFMKDSRTFLTLNKIEQNGSMIELWYFIKSDTVDLDLDNQYPQSFNSYVMISSINSNTFNDFIYPVFEGKFSHNFDIHRVKGIKCLQLDSGDSLSFLKESDYMSFWAWTSNAPSWSLYTADNTTGSWSLKRNNIDYDGSDISLTTSNSNIDIQNTSTPSDTLQFPPSSHTHSNVNFDGSRTATFDVSGSSYGNGTYKIVTNYTLSIAREYGFKGPYHIFDDVYNRDLSGFQSVVHSIDYNSSTAEQTPPATYDVTITLPQEVLLDNYSIKSRKFDHSGLGDAIYCPRQWKLYADVNGRWVEIDDQVTDQPGKQNQIAGDEHNDIITYTSGDIYTKIFKFSFVPTSAHFAISEIQLFAKQTQAYITDIKQYSQSVSDDYNDINVHPFNPTFGFSLQGHSADVGIAGYQLADTMRITNGDSLGDLEVNDLIAKGNVIANKVQTSTMFTDNVSCHRIQPVTPKTFLSNSMNYANAFFDSSGDLYLAGSNYKSLLGLNLPETAKVKEWVKSPIKFVSGDFGEEHSIFIDENGSAWAAGYAAFGAVGLNILGDVTVDSFNKITQYRLDYNDGSGDIVEIPPEHKWVSVGCARRTSFLLDANGDVWACGTNGDYGEVTLGLHISESSVHIPVFTRINKYDDGSGVVSDIPDNHRWVSIIPGAYHTILIDSSGIAWGFGYNAQNGALGLGTGGHRTIPTKITNYDTGSGSEAIPADHKWVSGACGYSHSVLIGSDGYAYSAGRNASYQLAHIGSDHYYVFTKINHAGHVSKVACGLDHTLLLKRDGTVYASGLNNYGQIGVGTTNHTDYDTITLEHPVTDIAGHTYSSSLISNNVVYVFGGSGTYGIDRSSSFSPIMSSNEITIPHLVCGTVQASSEFIISQSHPGPYHILELNSNTSSFIWTSYNTTTHDDIMNFGRRGVNVLEAWVYRKSTKTHENTIFSINFDDSIVRTASGTVQASDDRLKLNERVISDANVLLKLRPQVYDKLTGINGDIEGARFEAGLIAQEIWYDCPELRHLVSVGNGGEPAGVIKTSDDPSVDPDYSSWGPEVAGVNYTGLIPYLIRGFQEHSEKVAVIDSQKVEIFSLKKENAEMKARVASMEAQIAMLMKACGLVDSGNVDSA